MHITLGFMACVYATCWWTTRGIDTAYGYYYDARPPIITADWCRESGPYYLRDVTRVSKGNVPNFVAPSFGMGLPNVTFDPESIDCWPRQEGLS